MPLNLHLKTPSNVPLNVERVIPEKLCTENVHRISVEAGNRVGELGDYFDVAGTAAEDRTICFSGDLRNVYSIGQCMSTGIIEVQGDVGPFAGRGMSGGQIIVNGNADDYLGIEMTGGQINVRGNAADFVGANPPGGKYGTNHGTIFIEGSAGYSLGRRMRRGTIVVKGSVGALCGWEMLAGTIVVFGSSGDHTGLDMKRGTIILAGETADSFQPGSTFARGTQMRSQTVAMIAAWLGQSNVRLPAQWLNQRLLDRVFLQWHGDHNEGGRGEIFVAR